MVSLLVFGGCDKPTKTESSKETPPTLQGSGTQQNAPPKRDVTKTENATKTASGTSKTTMSNTSTTTQRKEPYKGKVAGNGDAAQPQAKTTTPDSAVKPSAGGEIVFNPIKPPAEYANCHHNHCHLVGGGVESYKQVMEKMGATKIIEPPKPPAPADVAGPPGDATRTASGLAYKELAAGSSDRKPTLESTVIAHVSSWSTDGTSLQSTSSRGRPANIPLGRVFKGLQEALMLMTVGSEYRFWIPGELTRRPERGMVVFDIQLLGSREPQAAP